uniref:EGF-like domain-containing protein n=1 Tax=Oryzias sinensis TaxID=183150 RepID=A0A8C8DM56_9TELE
MDECAEPSRCPGQMCVNSAGSYRCVSCRSGYKLTNRQCTDVDECESAAACESDRRCVNTAGSFRCECLPGYRASSLGRQCRGETGGPEGRGPEGREQRSEIVSCLLSDINECLEGDFCFSGGECLNTPGSYMCVCSQGFTLSSNGTACMGESMKTSVEEISVRRFHVRTFRLIFPSGLSVRFLCWTCLSDNSDWKSDK